MSEMQVTQLRAKIKQVGTWAGIRMMRNRGISLANAYFVLFDKKLKVS